MELIRQHFQQEIGYSYLCRHQSHDTLQDIPCPHHSQMDDRRESQLGNHQRDITCKNKDLKSPVSP